MASSPSCPPALRALRDAIQRREEEEDVLTCVLTDAAQEATTATRDDGGASDPPRPWWGALDVTLTDAAGAVVGTCGHAQLVCPDDALPLTLLAAKYGARAALRLLLRHGYGSATDVSVPPWRVSVLHMAARFDHVDMVADLLTDHGVDANERAQGAVTPLLVAASNNAHRTCALLLARGAHIEARAVEVGREDDDNPRLGTPLAHAVAAGASDAVRVLLEHGARTDVHMINSTRAPDMTLLHSAAARGHAAACDALLRFGRARRGMDVNARDAYGITPLHLAADRGHAAVCTTLCAHGADVDVVRTHLLATTPMHYAIRKRHTSVVRALLDAGADVRRLCNDRDTPLFHAITHGHADIVDALLAADEAAAARQGPSYDAQAADARARGPHGGSSTSFRVHTAYSVREGRGVPLLLAAVVWHASPDIVRVLASRGVDVNARLCGTYTALFMATARGRADMVDALLGAGADANAMPSDADVASTRVRVTYDVTGREVACDEEAALPPLPFIHELEDALNHAREGEGEGAHASQGEHARATAKAAAAAAAATNDDVEAILAAAVRVLRNVLQGHGVTDAEAEHYVSHFMSAQARLPPAVARDGAAIACVARHMLSTIASERALFDGDAVNDGRLLVAQMRANDGTLTPLAIACARGDVCIMRALLAGGAHVHATCTAHWAPATFPLIFSIMLAPRDDTLAVLLGAGANVDAHVTDTCETLMHVAAAWSGGRMPSGCLDVLLSAGANVNARTTRGATPLHVAALTGMAHNVTRLCAAGADVRATNEDGDTPLDVAQHAGHAHIVDILRAWGEEGGGSASQEEEARALQYGL